MDGSTRTNTGKIDSLIALKNVTKKYNPGLPTEVIAAKNISAEIVSGDYIAIVGPSGSGKSTLLQLMGCMDSPSSGEIWVDGIEISRLPERKLASIRREKVGFVFQSFYLIDTFTVEENILVPKIPQGISQDIRKYARKIAESLGLGERLNHKPGELSGGEQQRVAICRALINHPKILFADEPTGNLDSKRGIEIIEHLEKINQKQGTALIIVTHDSDIAARAGKIFRMHDGIIFT